MSKIAPGPWRFTLTASEYYQPGGYCPEILDANGLVIARVLRGLYEYRANARLISMAPTMLKGLEMAVLEFERIQYQKKCDPEVLAGLKKCIAMAKGEKLHVG